MIELIFPLPIVVFWSMWFLGWRYGSLDHYFNIFEAVETILKHFGGNNWNPIENSSKNLISHDKFPSQLHVIIPGHSTKSKMKNDTKKEWCLIETLPMSKDTWTPYNIDIKTLSFTNKAPLISGWISNHLIHYTNNKKTNPSSYELR